MAHLHVRMASRLVPLALTADEAAADRWRAALDSAGIAAEVRIEDGRALATGSSVLPTSTPFAYGLYVPAEREKAAAAVLIDVGWDGRRLGSASRGRSLDTRVALAGALGAAILALGAATLLWVLRGV